MKLSLVRVLPVVIALLVPSAALAEDQGGSTPASKTPSGATQATHAGGKHKAHTAKRAKAGAKTKKAPKAAKKAPKASKKAPKASKKAAAK